MGQKTDSWVPSGESRTFVFNFRDFLCGPLRPRHLFFSPPLCTGLIGPLMFEKEKNRCNKVISFKLFVCLKLCLALHCSLFLHLYPLSDFCLVFSLCVCVLHAIYPKTPTSYSGSLDKTPVYPQHYIKVRKCDTFPLKKKKKQVKNYLHILVTFFFSPCPPNAIVARVPSTFIR